MLINATSTQVHSFHSESTQKVVKTINDRVFEFIKNCINGHPSRNDIQRALGLTARQCSCSVWHLIEQNKIRLTGRTTVDPITKREVETVQVNDTPEIVFKRKSDRERLKEIRELCEYQISHKFGDLIDAKDILQIISQ